MLERLFGRIGHDYIIQNGVILDDITTQVDNQVSTGQIIDRSENTLNFRGVIAFCVKSTVMLNSTGVRIQMTRSAIEHGHRDRSG